MQRDQLNIERMRGTVFQGFEEGDCGLFKPSYKFEPGKFEPFKVIVHLYRTGTDLYEQRPEKKVRAPAWCDRVLWRCRSQVAKEFAIELLEYDRIDALRMSDHKPVRAAFRICIKREEADLDDVVR